MNKRLSTVILSTGLVIALVGSALGCAAKKPQAVNPQPAAPQISKEEMEKRWMDAVTPNENHKVLEALVGDWTATAKFWMAPGAEPEVSMAKSSNRWIYQGRYVEQLYHGIWNGQPFEGRGLWGYDNVAKQYQSSWVDSMSTQQFQSAGNFDPAKSTLTMTGDVSCPMTGSPRQTRSVTTIIDNNNHLFEMFSAGPDGAEFKGMEISYTRVVAKTKKAAGKKRKK